MPTTFVRATPLHDTVACLLMVSFTQSITATTSTETKLLAAILAVKVAKYLCLDLKKVGFEQSKGGRKINRTVLQKTDGLVL
jgi:hypothetical protein